MKNVIKCKTRKKNNKKGIRRSKPVTCVQIKTKVYQYALKEKYFMKKNAVDFRHINNKNLSSGTDQAGCGL